MLLNRQAKIFLRSPNIISKILVDGFWKMRARYKFYQFYGLIDIYFIMFKLLVILFIIHILSGLLYDKKL